LAQKNSNQVRLIAGKFRGRKITFVDSQGLRPTGDRLRETLFSWLQPTIAQSRVLDLFAGSGALGFEAASRGAESVTLIEKSRRVCAVLRQNKDQLELNNLSISCANALDVINNLSGGVGKSDCFDIVFVDPPFDDNLHQATVDALNTSDCLCSNAMVAIEGDRRAPPVDVPAGWQLQKDKVAGEVRLQLFLVS
jgi:16S rRNA (guanine966-N2)-methyltransferase